MTGTELLIAQAISGVAVPVFQTLWGSGGKVLGMFGKKLDEKAKQAIFAASRQYAQNYTKRHGILKVLGMRESVPLESVYTAVQFLDDESIRSFESVETLEEVYRQAKQCSFQPKNCQKQDGLKVANEKQILQTLLKAFRLNPELVNLSEEEAEAWKNYFYANYLMMRCKDAAVRVSPKTWAEIEERMLLVPNN